MVDSNDVPDVRLNNGVSMPAVGFGVFQMPDLSVCERAVSDALDVGYRMLDTASAYGNEEAVGSAIRRSGLARDEVFVVSKAYINEMGYERTMEAFERSLSKIGTDYLDLYLVHMPFGDYYGSWRAMEELYEEGRVKAIGISNFQSDRVIDMCYNTNVVPAVDQLEIHPFYQRGPEIGTLAEYGIAAMGWAPFAEGMNGMFTNQVLLGIAGKHGRTVAQVILRWNLQRGVPVIPKSVRRERMEENFDIFGFELDAEDMELIGGLDLGRPQMLDPRDPKEVRRVYGFLENPVVTTLNE